MKRRQRKAPIEAPIETEGTEGAEGAEGTEETEGADDAPLEADDEDATDAEGDAEDATDAEGDAEGDTGAAASSSRSLSQPPRGARDADAGDDGDDDDDDTESAIVAIDDRYPQIETDVSDKSFSEDFVVPEDHRRTSHIMSNSEYTEAISIRAEQISADGMDGAMIDSIPANATTARDIAIAEMKARRCPMKLVRRVGRTIDASGTIKNYIEVWSPNEMTHPAFQ